MATKRARGRETVADMVRSLGLVLVVVAVMILLTFRLSPRDPLQVIELGPQIAAARQSAPYGVLVPRGLDDGWRPVSASTRVEGAGTIWRIGWVTPADDFAAFGQSDQPSAAFVDTFASGAAASGEAVIAGQRWARLGGAADEERSLVRRDGAVTVVVTGTAGFAELAELAASLAPA
jgi:hypothetical protein